MSIPVEFESRIMGGQLVNFDSMSYVVKLEFQEKQSNSFNQLCAGTVVHKHFIVTTKFCCESGDTVTITFNGQNADEANSNTFYFHSNLDSCLIRMEADLSSLMVQMPCLPNHIDVNKYNGAACWNAGWGTVEVDGIYSNELQSIGVNLMSREYCTDHSFLQLEEHYMCAGLPPNDSTPMTGWKHVTAGGKGTCQGDFGAPLICDIDGIATFMGRVQIKYFFTLATIIQTIYLGIYTDGDTAECGQAGKPPIHLSVIKITDWIEHIIEDHAPPRTCFKLTTDPSVEDSLGDEIKLFKNGVEVGAALGAQQISNERCIEYTSDGDVFEFRNSGKDNVCIYP